MPQPCQGGSEAAKTQHPSPGFRLIAPDPSEPRVAGPGGPGAGIASSSAGRRTLTRDRLALQAPSAAASSPVSAARQPRAARRQDDAGRGAASAAAAGNNAAAEAAPSARREASTPLPARPLPPPTLPTPAPALPRSPSPARGPGGLEATTWRAAPRPPKAAPEPGGRAPQEVGRWGTEMCGPCRRARCPRGTSKGEAPSWLPNRPEPSTKELCGSSPAPCSVHPRARTPKCAPGHPLPTRVSPWSTRQRLGGWSQPAKELPKFSSSLGSGLPTCKFTFFFF